MADAEEPPTLEYTRRESLRENRQRTYYCLGLPLIAYGLGMALGQGREQVPAAMTMAAGAFQIAMALPVQE